MKTGFYEVKPGNQSFTRLCIAWYFWSICFAGSAWILYVFGKMAIDDVVIRNKWFTLTEIEKIYNSGAGKYYPFTGQ